jgi:hypothetical protein
MPFALGFTAQPTEFFSFMHNTKTRSGVVRRSHLSCNLVHLAMFGPFSIDTIFPAFGMRGAELQANPWAM